MRQLADEEQLTISRHIVLVSNGFEILSSGLEILQNLGVNEIGIHFKFFLKTIFQRNKPGIFLRD